MLFLVAKNGLLCYNQTENDTEEGELIMWLLLACLSALFAGLMSITAKLGIKHTDSNVATAIRTIVVLIFSWVMVFVTGQQTALAHLDGRGALFLVLSGVATGASWLCYFRALQLGDVNKVVPIDKSSTVLTILLAIVLLGETTTALKVAGMALLLVGALLMIDRKSGAQNAKDSRWLLYAVGSAVFAALTSILAKMGMQDIPSNLATALRTGVVLVMAWVVVLVTGRQREVTKISRRELAFICVSGLMTGASWLCYFAALKDGPASVVVPIDKLSVLVTVAFSVFVLHEKMSKKAWIGLALLAAGTLCMVFA